MGGTGDIHPKFVFARLIGENQAKRQPRTREAISVVEGLPSVRLILSG